MSDHLDLHAFISYDSTTNNRKWQDTSTQVFQEHGFVSQIEKVGAFIVAILLGFTPWSQSFHLKNFKYL